MNNRFLREIQFEEYSEEQGFGTHFLPGGWVVKDDTNPSTSCDRAFAPSGEQINPSSLLARKLVWAAKRAKGFDLFPSFYGLTEEQASDAELGKLDQSESEILLKKKAQTTEEWKQEDRIVARGNAKIEAREKLDAVNIEYHIDPTDWVMVDVDGNRFVAVWIKLPPSK